MKRVYCLDFEKRVKIGITDNIDRRIHQIQCAAGARVIRYFSVEGDFALEALTQKRFMSHHIAGEFFECSFEDVCKFLAEQVGQVFSLKDICIPNPNVPPRTGRPTDNPKGQSTHLRLDAASVDVLARYTQQEQVSRAEAIRRGILKLEEDIKK